MGEISCMSFYDQTEKQKTLTKNISTSLRVFKGICEFTKILNVICFISRTRCSKAQLWNTKFYALRFRFFEI